VAQPYFRNLRQSRQGMEILKTKGFSIHRFVLTPLE